MGGLGIGYAIYKGVKLYQKISSQKNHEPPIKTSDNLFESASNKPTSTHSYIYSNFTFGEKKNEQKNEANAIPKITHLGSHHHIPVYQVEVEDEEQLNFPKTNSLFIRKK